MPDNLPVGWAALFPLCDTDRIKAPPLVLFAGDLFNTALLKSIVGCVTVAPGFGMEVVMKFNFVAEIYKTPDTVHVQTDNIEALSQMNKQLLLNRI